MTDKKVAVKRRGKISITISGAQGTGKTALAQHIASYLRRQGMRDNMITIDGVLVGPDPDRPVFNAFRRCNVKIKTVHE